MSWKRTLRFSCIGVLFCSIGCARTGDNPGGPSANLPPLTVVSGEDSRTAVVGVQVVVDGKTYSTDSLGQVLALPADVLAGSRDISLQADGYLERLTRYRGDAVFTLWPLVHGTTPEYLRQLVFHEWSPGGRLSRIIATRVLLVPGAGFAGDQVRLEELRAAAATVSAVNGHRVHFEVVEGSAQGVVWTVQVDDNDPYMQQGFAGAAYVNYQGNVSNGGKIVVAPQRGNVRDILEHEIGHTLGLGHSPDVGDRMYYRLSPSGPFKIKEEVAIRVMYQRMPGTLPPDNDREQTSGGVPPLVASSVPSGTYHQQHIACPF